MSKRGATHGCAREAGGQGRGPCLRARPEQVRASYEPGTYRRLAKLKAVYDPSNMFRLNHNIPPAA